MVTRDCDGFACLVRQRSLHGRNRSYRCQSRWEPASETAQLELLPHPAAPSCGIMWAYRLKVWLKLLSGSAGRSRVEAL